MRAWGHVSFVDPRSRGSETLTAALAGSETLTLYDMSDFLGSDGMIDLDQVGAPIAFTEATIGDDGLSGTLALAAPLAADLAAGTLVQVWVGGGPVVEYVASVTLTTGGEALAVLRDSKILHLPSGPRADGAQELVSLRWSDEDATWVVESVEQQIPKVSAKYLTPGTAKAAVVDTSDPGWVALVAGLGGGGGTLAFLDGGLNGATPIAFVDGGLYS